MLDNQMRKESQWFVDSYREGQDYIGWMPEVSICSLRWELIISSGYESVGSVDVATPIFEQQQGRCGARPATQ
jgi:hypothetical protein